MRFLTVGLLLGSTLFASQRNDDLKQALKHSYFSEQMLQGFASNALRMTEANVNLEVIIDEYKEKIASEEGFAKFAEKFKDFSDDEIAQIKTFYESTACEKYHNPILLMMISDMMLNDLKASAESHSATRVITDEP